MSKCSQLKSSIGITLVDVHQNWLNWFCLVFLEEGLLVILIDCMIFLSPFLDVTRISKDMFKKMWPSVTLQKLKNHKFLFYLKMKPHMKIFFAHRCFKSCYGYFVTFSVKIWSKEAHRYKSNILLLLCQYAFIDVFFRKLIIEIWEINLWRVNSSINVSRERMLTEIVGHFCNIGTKIRKCVMKFD